MPPGKTRLNLPFKWELGGAWDTFVMTSDIHFQHAKSSDVSTIVALLADDPLGSKRERFESPLPARYYDAFASINEDPNNELIVATLDERVLAVLQLTFIPSLTYQGGWRSQIEGVPVASEFRSKGIGRDIFQWPINRARERNCHMVQLTTDKGRPDSLRFYESLGFKATHEGLKLHLDTANQALNHTS